MGCPFLSRLVTVACLTAVTGPTFAEIDDAAKPNAAKNLARLNCGARITWVSTTRGNESDVARSDQGSATDLLLDDNTLNCQLAQGTHTLMVALPNISNLDRFAFIKERPEMTGTVQVFVSNYRVSPNDTSWVPVENKVSFGSQRFVNLPLSAVEAKYVKIVFDVRKPGTIAGLSLYGQRTLAAFATQKTQVESAAAKVAYSAMTSGSRDNLNFNFANLYARANVVSVSSGSNQLVSRMIDDDPTTSFDFAPNDPHPTVVVELEADQRLRRVSAVYEAVPGRLDIYLLNQLPGPDTLDHIQPVMSIDDNNASGKAAADFYPRGARYVALRWTPAAGFNHRRKFKVAEIGAFSDLTFGVFDLAAIPEQLAQSNMIVDPGVQPPAVLPISP